MNPWKKIVWMWILVLAALPVAAQITLGKKDVKCNGEANGKVTVLSISNATYPIQSYAWSNGASGPDKKSIDHLAGGTYTVTVTDANLCTGTASITVEEPESSLGLEITSSSDEYFVCGTSSIIVSAFPSGGTPPYNTNGSPGMFAKRVSLSSFGNGPKFLDFQTTDANGCTKKQRQFFAFSAIACASDPNDITGPIGIEEPRWVAARDRMEYTIRFENDPVIATAPAQVVKVKLPVDPKVNPFSLQLGDFGWGPYQFAIPEGSTFYQTRLDLSDSLNLYIDVTAGYNINANEYFWYLESVDPATGQLPLNPLQGFLPVNDSLTGSGEGFIRFSILPKTNAVTGDSIWARAEIIFDANESIWTNTWKNKLDAVAPVSELHALVDSSENNVISLSWSAMDDAGGVGVRDYELFVSADHGPLTLVEEEIEDTIFIYEAVPGFQYGFVVLATDSVGNRELMKPVEDSIYIISQRRIQLTAPAGHDLCVQDSLTVRWLKVTVDTVRLDMSLDSGDTWFVLDSALAVDSFTMYLDTGLLADHIYLRLTDVEDTSVHILSQPLAIHALPVVNAGDDAYVCAGSYLILAAMGANTYVWDSIASLNLYEVYNPRATPDTTSAYPVTGYDVYGCRDRDTVILTVLPTYLDSVTYLMCNEDSIFLEGAYQTEPGFYTDELASIGGCDSTVVTEVILTGPCPFPSDQVYVDKDALGLNNGTSWANAFTHVQDALAAVEYYEDVREIWIAEGEYVPSVIYRDSSFTLRDSVVIYGGFLGTETLRDQRVMDPSLVKLSGDIGLAEDSTDNVYHVVVVDSSCVDCVLDGLTISFGHANGVPASSSIGAGLFVKGKIVLEDLIIERNTTLLDGAAIYNTGVNAILTIRDCLFRLNTSGLARDILNGSGAQIEFQGMNTVQN